MESFDYHDGRKGKEERDSIHVYDVVQMMGESQILEGTRVGKLAMMNLMV